MMHVGGFAGKLLFAVEHDKGCWLQGCEQLGSE
jgi:hypothetical protein